MTLKKAHTMFQGKIEKREQVEQLIRLLLMLSVLLASILDLFPFWEVLVRLVQARLLIYPSKILLECTWI